MKKYDKVSVILKNIELDKMNPRFSTYDKSLKKDMLLFMIKDDILAFSELTEDILDQNSLNPISNIAAFKENNK
jgi:hypothetical protein